MNPFKAIRKIGTVFVKVLTTAFCVAAVGVLQWILILQYGWWGLMFIPGVIVGGVLLMLIGVLFSNLGDLITSKWRKAERNWENRRRSEK